MKDFKIIYFICNECGNTWDAIATTLKDEQCPACNQFDIRESACSPHPDEIPDRKHPRM